MPIFLQALVKLKYYKLLKWTFNGKHMMWPGGKLDRSTRLSAVQLQLAAPGPVLLFYPKEAKVQPIHSSILSSALAGGYRLRALRESRRWIQKPDFIHIGKNFRYLSEALGSFRVSYSYITWACVWTVIVWKGKILYVMKHPRKSLREIHSGQSGSWFYFIFTMQQIIYCKMLTWVHDLFSLQDMNTESI